MRGRGLGLGIWLGFGYAFLYLPILVLMALSFNASRLATLWAGFSFRWYGELLGNERLIEAAWFSLAVAAAAATLATAVGTAAGLALARRRRIPWRGAFVTLLLAPMILPETIVGLSLLMLFVSTETTFGWPKERGFSAIVAAHATLGVAYVALIVRARLNGFDPAIEEAAADLGATPRATLLGVTLPMLAPALAAGWLLAFTLSLDDLVVASFVAGPGATTLPMIVFSSVRLGMSPQINALATIVVVAVAGALALACALQGSSKGRGTNRLHPRQLER